MRSEICKHTVCHFMTPVVYVCRTLWSFVDGQVLKEICKWRWCLERWPAVFLIKQRVKVKVKWCIHKQQHHCGFLCHPHLLHHLWDLSFCFCREAAGVTGVYVGLLHASWPVRKGPNDTTSSLFLLSNKCLFLCLSATFLPPLWSFLDWLFCREILCSVKVPVSTCLFLLLSVYVFLHSN